MPAFAGMTVPNGQSELFTSSGIVILTRLGNQPIQLAGLGIALDLFIEHALLKLIEPSTKLGELLRRELRYGLLDFFNSRHWLRLEARQSFFHQLGHGLEFSIGSGSLKKAS
jgi:hypothetical protein